MTSSKYMEFVTSTGKHKVKLLDDDGWSKVKHKKCEHEVPLTHFCQKCEDSGYISTMAYIPQAMKGDPVALKLAAQADIKSVENALKIYGKQLQNYMTAKLQGKTAIANTFAIDIAKARLTLLTTMVSVEKTIMIYYGTEYTNAGTTQNAGAGNLSTGKDVSSY